MRLLFNYLFVFLLFFPASATLADTSTCNRSSCEGGVAIVHSTDDDPAIICDDPALCEYVDFYLNVQAMTKAGEADPHDPQDLLVLQRKMQRAGLGSFEEAAGRYRQATHGQRVQINFMDFKKELAYVKPTLGGKEYWISFDSLIPVARTAKEYPFGGKVTEGSAIVASLVNSGTTIYGVRAIEREADAALPQSFDERISFLLEGYEPRGGQIFICSSKKFCDSIHGYFSLLSPLAGPYLFRSKNGKIVAQLNGNLSPDVAKIFEAALFRIKR